MSGPARVGITRRTMLAAGAALLMVAAVLVAGPSQARPAAATRAASGTFRLMQLNMCMWGVEHYVLTAGQKGVDSCFPNRYYWRDSANKAHKTQPAFDTEEKNVAARKRQAVVDQIKAYDPDAVTVNEACDGDMGEIVKTLRAAGLTYYHQSVHLTPFTQAAACSEGRGARVNAVIAHSFAGGAWRGDRFTPQSVGNRAWMCAVTKGVRVCTAHLSLPEAANNPQQFECNNMRAILREGDATPTLFAGDTNLSWKRRKSNCMPIGWAGLQDIETLQGTPGGEEGMQQIYVGPQLTRGHSCGQTHPVPWPDGTLPVPGGATSATDHQAFLLDLRPTATPSRGLACTDRDVRPAGYTQDSKRIGGYVFHQEPHAGWTGPAAARLALSMRLRQDPPDAPQPHHVYPTQDALHAELGAAPTPAAMTRVLNEHISADRDPAYYKTRTSPTTAQLSHDMKFDLIRGFAIVARVKGVAYDTRGRKHTAANPSFVAVVGYYDNGAHLTIENLGAKRTGDPNRTYRLTTSAFVKWMDGGYSA